MDPNDPFLEIKRLFDLLNNKVLTSPRELAGIAYNAYFYFIKKSNWSHRDEFYQQFSDIVDEISNISSPHTIVIENVGIRLKKILHSIFYPKSSDYPENPDYAHQVVKDLQIQNLKISNDKVSKIENTEFQITPNAESSEDIGSLCACLAEELNLFRLELESCIDDISFQAIQHIHSNETVMIYGHSHTVEVFIRHAAKRRKFSVIVCQTSPDNVGHLMVARLSTAPNIEITLIPDSCIHAMMARVNKLILSCYSVTAEGSLCARAGVLGLVLSAYECGVPILVCTGMYKISTRYSFNQFCCCRDIDFSYLTSPSKVIDYRVFRTFNQVQVYNPTFDFIPSQYITLFVTNKGDFSPSYIYRLLKEMYRIEQDF